jgi:hypothetical protein
VGWRATFVVPSELFEAAVINTKTPNFEQGLFHLDKMWELHKGVAVTAVVLIQQHLDKALRRFEPRPVAVQLVKSTFDSLIRREFPAVMNTAEAACKIYFEHP